MTSIIMTKRVNRKPFYFNPDNYHCANVRFMTDYNGKYVEMRVELWYNKKDANYDLDLYVLRTVYPKWDIEEIGY